MKWNVWLREMSSDLIKSTLKIGSEFKLKVDETARGSKYVCVQFSSYFNVLGTTWKNCSIKNYIDWYFISASNVINKRIVLT